MDAGEPPLWAIVYVLGNELAAAIAIVLAVYAWRHRSEPGATPLVLIMTGAATWCSMVVLHILSEPAWLTHRFVRVMYVGIALVVVGAFTFAIEFTGREQYLNRWTTVLLSIHPVAMGLVVLFAPEYLWTSVEPAATLTGIDTEWGPAFSIHLLYTYTLVGASVLLICVYIIRMNSIYQRQGLVILLGAGTVVIGNLVHLLGLTPVDLASVSYVVTGLAFGWAIFSYDLIDLTPIARRTAWDQLEDAVLTLDEDNRVVDANEAARELFDVEGDPVGLPASVFFEDVPDEVLQRFADDGDVDTRITTQIEGETCHLSLTISPIDGRSDQRAGRVIVLRDVTSIERREQELELLKQVQSRVLRHNIRNELTTVRGNAQLVETVVDGEYEDRIQDVIEASDDLLSISAKARVVEEIIDESAETTEYDLRDCVEEAVLTIRREHPELDVSLTGAEECSVEAIPQLQTAVENLLENAAVHNDSSDPRARVRLKNGDRPRLTISDNGPGIPDQEIDVLQHGAETSLEHGSGIGLWTVKWIADRSNADLEFESTADGTDVAIQFG